jgi:hypothetical protein
MELRTVLRGHCGWRWLAAGISTRCVGGKRITDKAYRGKQETDNGAGGGGSDATGCWEGWPVTGGRFPHLAFGEGPVIPSP